MAEAALELAPIIDLEVEEALGICEGDPIKALRITLIANAFLEAQVDELQAQISTGFGCQKISKAKKRKAA